MSVSGTLPRADQAGTDAKTVAALIAMAAFFSTNIVIGRGLVGETGPWTLALFRWTGAVLLLLPFTGAGLVSAWPSLRAEASRLVVLGFLGMIVCGGGVYIALAHTSANNATLIYTASPAFAVLIEATTKRRMPSPTRLIGLTLAIAGIATIVFRGDPAEAAALSFRIGDLGIAAAALSWAGYGVILRGARFGSISTPVSFTAIALVGVGLLVPPALVEIATGTSLPSDAAGYLSIAALALFPSVLAYSLYQYGVRRVGAAGATMFLYLMPVFGVLLAWLLLGEAFRMYHAAGFVLVLGGVVLATTHRKLQ